MKRVFYIVIWLGFSVAVLTLFGFISKEKSSSRCRGLEINIDRSDNNYFIQEDEIKEMFFNMGYNVDSQLLEEIDTRKIEQQVYNNPSAQKAEVYKTVDGKIKIEITQRKPVLRVFTAEGESFYIDDQGWVMPLSEKYAARVLVANGFISGNCSNIFQSNLGVAARDSGLTILTALFKLTQFIVASKFWNAQITQIYVNAEGEIELVPRVGNHMILFGDTSDMEIKFNRLMVFYREGLKKTGWNNYSQINLKFKNQVVCKKN